MAILQFSRETRDSNPQISGISLDDFANHFLGGSKAFSGETVTVSTAMGVPAVACAVHSISGALAQVPLQLFKKTKKGPVKDDRNPIYRLLHDVVNSDGLTSFQWRKWAFESLLTKGRAVTFIERNSDTHQPKGLWPMWNTPTTRIAYKAEAKRLFNEDIAKGAYVKYYEYTSPDGPTSIFRASEVIDLVWSSTDGCTAVSPVHQARNAIGQAIAAQRYASSVFENGGMPPLVLYGPSPASPAAAARAGEDIMSGFKVGSRKGKNFLGPLPKDEYEFKELGFDPSKTQLLETQKFCVVDIARVFNIPPVMLHDLTFGSFSNTEQQWLSFVRSTLLPYSELFEQELNNKLFLSAGNRTNFAEINLDGLQRGDFASRMKGYQSAINSAVLTPDEARALENRPAHEGGDQLFIQSGTLPIQSLPAYDPAAPAVTSPPDPVGEPDEDGDVEGDS